MPASRTVPSSPSPSVQGSPRTRDWRNLKMGEPGSAFRGISRGRGSRGGSVRGGRGLSTNVSSKGSNHPDTTNSTPSPSPTAPVLQKLPVSASTTGKPSSLSEKAVNGTTERGGRPKSGSRKQSRPTPMVVISTASPSTTAPSTPSRSASAHRRRRPQSGKGSSATTKLPALPDVVKTENSSTPSSQTILRKDVPPHLAAAHEAEIRHDIDVFVERVRAVAMADNRPTTPGSHIDWAGDEDDSLPDLDDWGVTATHTNVTHGEDKSDEISPILADTLKTLPEPNSEVHHGEDPENNGVESNQTQEFPIEPSFLPSPTQGTAVVPLTTDKSLDQCIVVPAAVEELSSRTLSDGNSPFHPSLPPKPVAAIECLHSQGKSISKPLNLSVKPVAAEEALTTRTEGLAESIHAPPMDEHPTLERVSSSSSSERGLAASIHAPVPGLPESHSAPSILSTRPTSTGSRSHSRSQTEGRLGMHQPHSGPPSTISHRHGRSGASSPLGKHVHTHSRNHSTPTVGVGSRLPQASRPIITGDAISRLARTIGGHGPTPRTQTIPVTKDSTISS